MHAAYVNKKVALNLLDSTNSRHYVLPRTWLKLSEWSGPSPMQWNSLPASLCEQTVTATFRRQLNRAVRAYGSN